MIRDGPPSLDCCMTYRTLIPLIIFSGLLLVPAVFAADNVVPRDGTVYIGEANLDLSNCNIHSGDEIAWWDSGTPQGAPTARARVGEIRSFTVDPETFRGHTGIWYGLIGKKPAFTVEEPVLQIDLNDNGLDTKPDTIKRGSLVSFQISTNLAGLSKRVGSSGAVVTINLTGPNETVYHTLSSSQTNEFNLDKVFVYDTPYDTGAVWDTSDAKKFPDGEYTISAITNVNQINDNYPDTGATCTEKKTYTLGKTGVKPTPTETVKPGKTTKVKGDSVTAESVKTETPTEKPAKDITSEPTPKGKTSQKTDTNQKNSVKETGTPTEEPTKEVTGEPTPGGKANKTVKASEKVENNLTAKKTLKPTPEVTRVQTMIETPEPTPEVTDVPTPVITPHPTRTPFPRPPGPGASPTKPSPLPMGITLIALAVGIMLIGVRRRQ